MSYDSFDFEALSVGTLNDNDDGYWRSATPEDRLAALEFLRQVMYTYDPVSDRFREFLKLLNSQGVEYLVVGGYAVAFHGHPRTTGDFWIGTTPENVTRTRAALREFGFGEEQVTSAPFHLPKKVIRIGRPPLRIEILTSVSGVEFAECLSKREIQPVDSFESI